MIDDKYNVRKPAKPATKQEEIQEKIEALIKRRDQTPNPAEKQKLQSEIMSLFAQYERLKL
ncbi:MAG: hypothetical protein AB7V18_10885 [Pyrinomonadaceae bacterium]